MTNKTTMPEPVAYMSKQGKDSLRIFGQSSVVSGAARSICTEFIHGLITTDQAEAYADACVREALEWQPIETAPKNKFVLLCGPSGYTTTPLVFTTGRMCSDYHAGRWIDHANDDLSDWGFVPTHWMPLPAAPSPTDEDARHD